MAPCGLVGEYVMPPCRLKVTHCHDLEYHSIFTPSYCHLVHVISCPCVIMFFRFNPYPANVENMVSSYNASRWQMGFNVAFKGLKLN